MAPAGRWFIATRANMSTRAGSPAIPNARAGRDGARSRSPNELTLAEAERIAKLGSWQWDLETGEMRWSEQLFAVFGLSLDAAPRYETFRERVHPDDIARVEDELRSNLAGRLTETRCDHRVRLPDGTVKMIEGRGHIIRDANGRAIRVVGTCLDVTEAWTAHEALRASEERFRSLIKATAAVQWRTDAAGEQTEATATWYEFTGMSAAEMAAPNAWEAALHPDDRARAAATWRRATESGLDFYCEYRLRRNDGVWRNMIARGVPVRNGDGSVREWIGTCVDVTELKAADQAMRFQAQVLDTIGESIIATDPAGKIIYLNRFAETQFGWSAREAIGADVVEITVPDTSREQAAEIMDALRRGEPWRGEFTARRRDGMTFPARASNTPLYNDAGELVALVGVARDMTEYEESQRALRESEERYRSMVDQAAVGVCEITFDDRFERVNPRLCELFGYPADELLQLRFSDITHPADLALSVQLVGELVREQRDSFAIDKRYVRKDGSVMWAFSTVSLIRDENGKPHSLIAVVEDITARKAAEEKLRFQAHMLDSAGEAIVATDPDGVAIYINEHAELLYGWPKEEALGRNIVDLLLPPEIAARARAQDIMAQLRAGAHANGEYFLQRRDGSVVRASISISLVRDGEGQVQAIIGICRDVTEINRAREDLIQSQERLRALTGRLESSREAERTRIARAIHDELGQLLTGLKMDLRWVEDWLEKSDDVRLRPFLDRIVGSNELTDAIIKAVQGIAAELRPGVLDTLGLRSALEFEARRFQERTGTMCVIKPATGEMPPLDPDVTTALFRIFQECLTNIARHAGATRVEVMLELLGDEVHLCVSDNGRGMADIERASFESLGLLGIRERVNLLGGTVSFRSSEKSGTTISLRVPVSAHPQSQVANAENTNRGSRPDKS